MSLRIHLFGKFEIYRNSHLIQQSEWRTEKAKTLLKILLTEPERHFSQDELIHYLWDEEAPKNAEQTLRVLVNYLRKALEPDLEKGRDSSFIKTVSGKYYFSQEECFIDTEEFKKLYRQGLKIEREKHFEKAIELYQQAVELYHGEFLIEENHEEWALNVRNSLHIDYADMLKRLIENLCTLNRYQEAISYCLKAISLAPFQEDSYRKLMECHVKTGNPTAALEVYERCRKKLSENGFVPSPETEGLYQSIYQRIGATNEKTATEQALEKLKHDFSNTNDLKKRLELSIKQTNLLAILGRRDELTNVLETALQYANELNDSQKIGEVHYKRASYFLSVSDFVNAKAAAENALKAFRSINNKIGIANALQALGTSLSDAGKYNDANNFYHDALTTIQDLETIEADNVRMRLWLHLGNVDLRQQKFPEALTHFEKSYRVSQKLDNFSIQASILLNLGSVHNRWGHTALAKHFWEEGHALAHRIGQSSTEVRCTNNLAALTRREGNLEQALKLFAEVVEVKEQLQDQSGLANAWNSLGVLYQTLGQYDRALDAFDRSRKYHESIGNSVGVAMVNITSAEVYTAQHHYSNAQTQFEQSLVICEQAGNRWWQIQALLGLGCLFQEKNNHEKASEYLMSAVLLAEEIKSKMMESPTKALLAVSKAACGQLQEAIALANSVVKDLESEPTLESLGIYFDLFQVFSASHDTIQARHFLKKAYTTIAGVGKRLQNPEFKKSFFKVKLHREILKAWESV
jgi:DNA-binding SARP family transcriptional activator